MELEIQSTHQEAQPRRVAQRIADDVFRTSIALLTVGDNVAALRQQLGRIVQAISDALNELDGNRA